jgi:signal transduction histidine kinase
VVIGLAVYSHEIANAISLSQTNARLFAERAVTRHETFQNAAIEFELRAVHEGMHSFAAVRPGRPRREPESEPRIGERLPPRGVPQPMLPPPHLSNDEPETAIVDGVVVHDGPGVRRRFTGNRFGYAIATLFGARLPPLQPFLNGAITFGPDPDLFQNIAFVLTGAVLLASLAIGTLAFVIGRYITQQAIRPLIEVTEALQRFAARDFRTQSITLGRKSDFDILAYAYNAAAEQVSVAFAERDAAEAQMRQFVADAGHELRTPLTIVLGYIDLLRRRVSDADERSKFIFSSIAAEGRRMRTLVDNLVLLAKLEGEDTRPTEPFDVNALIAEIVEVRRGVAPSVRFDVETPVPATAIADRSDVYEAVANIVDNAIKYALGSPIRITTRAPHDGILEISIADDGPGIAPEDRDSIFERFFRGASRGEVEGSGLGLAIAKRAIERAGGTVRLDTSVARGTRFVIGLRADRTPAPERAAQRA